MNIQDIGIDINALENKKELYYKLELAKPNQEIIGVIVNSYGNNSEFNFNGIHELNFTVPYTVNGNQNVIKIEKRYDEILKEIDNLSENISSTFTPHTSIESQQIKELMYVKLSYFDKHEWFVIDSINDSISDDDEMEVNCFSLPYELKRKKIFSEIDLGTVTIREVLENTLLLDTGWKLGNVATELSELYRNIKISNGDKYNSIIEVAESFGAVLDWNSDNKTINLLFLENTLKNKGLIINSENLLNSLSRERTTENILTRMYIYGNENMSVENVNPTGQRYIEDFSYFIEPFERDSGKNILKHSYYMSDALCHALLDIKELSNQILPQIKSKQTDITNKLSSLSEIMIEVIEAENKVGILKGLLDVAKATGDAPLTSQRQSELDLAESQLNVLMSQQSSLEGQIEALNIEIASMQKQIDTTSFTEELKNELAPFIIEGEFKDDRYIDETELYNDAVKEFIKNRDPKQVLKVDLATVLNDPENIYYRDKINLGDLATVRYPNANIDFQEPIVSMSIDFDEFDIKLDISEHDDDLEPLDRLVSLIYDTSSSMATLEGNKYKWDTIINIKNIVDEMRDGVIDATRNRIIAGVNESVNIGSDGIILTNPDFPNDMIIMQSGVIALSQDGGKNWDTSVTAKGIMADTIIGRLLVGNELIISNDSGSFVIDSNGLTIDIDSIKIMSGESGTPEDMIQKWNSVLNTIADMTDDGVLNEYEKNQLEKQFLAEKTAYSEMIKAYKESMGPETPENQYSLEFDNLVKAYEDMNTLLNVTLQSDGFAILDINNRTKTTTVDPNIFNSIINGFTTAKEVFLVKTPMDFTATAIEQTKNYISLNYVKNGEVVNEINLSEDGIKIDGSKIEISGDTTFKDDLIMSSGKITSSDGTSFVIDMNNNRIDLGKTLYINGNVVLTSGDVANDVVKTTKVYGESMSPLTQPTVWTETPPAWQDGYYIWELSTEHLRNGTTRELEPVNITGPQGPQGIQGQDGKDGADGEQPFYAYADIDSIVTAIDRPNEVNYEPSNTSYYFDEDITSLIDEHGLDGWKVSYDVKANAETIEELTVFTEAFSKYDSYRVSHPTTLNYEHYEQLITFKDTSVGRTTTLGVRFYNTPFSLKNFMLKKVGNISNFSTSWTTQKYQGVYVGDERPTDPNAYEWARIQGDDGTDGKTAYEIALEKGFQGTEEEWLASIDGKDGKDGADGVGITSYENYYKLTSTTSKPTNTSETGWSNIAPPTTSTDKYLWMYSKIQLSNGEINRTSPAIISMFSESGKSAYDLAKEQGYSGTLNEWIESLKGAKGDDGAIRSTIPPTDLTKLWLDESITPAKLKFHDGSDWVSFDEEIFLELDELSEATTTVSSELQTLNDSIMAEVKSAQSDILSNQEVTNSLRLTQDSFTEEFNRVKSGIDANGEYIESLKATITSTVDEDMNPYTEWKSGDDTRVIVGSNAISMDSAGVETFRIENGEARATSLYVTNEIGFGNHTAKKYGTDFTIFSWTGKN